MRESQTNKIPYTLILADIDNNTGEFIKDSIKEFEQYKGKEVVIKGK